MFPTTAAFALSPASAFTAGARLLQTSARRSSPLTPRHARARLHTTKTTMGLDMTTITEGDGTTFPKAGQTVLAHYTGTLTDGSKFDSSRDRGEPFQFVIGKGQVIKAWDEGIMKMTKGQRVKMEATHEYAYGPNGMPPIIPPSATLIFDVELIDIIG